MLVVEEFIRGMAMVRPELEPITARIFRNTECMAAFQARTLSDSIVVETIQQICRFSTSGKAPG
jgi:hypothetical protein